MKEGMKKFVLLKKQKSKGKKGKSKKDEKRKPCYNWYINTTDTSNYQYHTNECNKIQRTKNTNGKWDCNRNSEIKRHRIQ